MKKAALLQVLQLQQIFIDKCGETEDADWHEAQVERLKSLRLALNAARLEAVDLELLVPPVQSDAPTTAELLPFRLRINARSQLSFYSSSQFGGSSSSNGDEDVRGSQRVFFIDSLRRACLPALPSDDVHGNAASASAAAAATTCNLDIDLAGAPPLSCATSDAAELVEVLSAHLRRYNASCAWQVVALKRLHALKCTPFAVANSEHSDLLRRLWDVSFGGGNSCDAGEVQTVSERWLHVGFQCADPTKDFRGMGVLALSNLVYFAEAYTDVFLRLITKQRKRDYPLACAGINITSLLLDLLNLRNLDEDAVQARPLFDAEWSSDLFFFFCRMPYRERPFEDMYCFALRLLDRMYVAMDADYADFNRVLAALRVRLVDALAARPLSFREFKKHAAPS